MDMGISISINKSYLSGFTPILEAFAKPQTAWFIPAQLWSDYAGAAIRVRRASDDAETDINYVNGLLDESAISSHCGASEGFITTAYDQSGNSNDWSQSTTTLQPKIYDGSAVIKINGYPAMLSDDTSGTQSSLEVAAGGANTATSFHCIYTTRNNTILIDGDAAYCGYAVNGNGSSTAASAGTPSLYVNGSSVADTRDALYDAIVNQHSIISMTGLDLLDGAKWDTYRTDDTSSNFLYPVDNHQGLIIYDSDQSANRSAIEAALNNFLGVY
jgi:hypothetical protein